TSSSFTFRPFSMVVWPFTFTHPFKISASASRLEQIPSTAILFASRIESLSSFILLFRLRAVKLTPAAAKLMILADFTIRLRSQLFVGLLLHRGHIFSSDKQQ